MASKKQTLPSPAALRAAFLNDLAAAWNRARTLHPRHKPYAFTLYGVEGAPRLSAHVLTEESLTEVANDYLRRGAHDTLEEARKGLRYSMADSPLFSELTLPTVAAGELYFAP